MPPPDEYTSKIVASSASGTTFLIIIQLTSRLVTFIANQLILRSLSPAILGISAQLELYFISILYFSRESIRTAIQRQPLTPASKAVTGDSNGRSVRSDTAVGDTESRYVASQSAVNMSYLSLGIGIPLALAFAMFYMQWIPVEVSKTPFSRLSVIVTTIAALLELCSEPFFTIVQQYMMYKERAIVEMSAALLKSFSVCSLFLWASSFAYNFGTLPFALGYLCHSLTLICGYYFVATGLTGQSRVSLLPVRIVPSGNQGFYGRSLPKKLVLISANVFFQSVIKHLLTQGDSMMLAALTSLEDQGTYALASNYGGLIARILFQPIEEGSRAMFASLLNCDASTEKMTGNLSAAKTQLIDILWAYGMLSLVVVPLGPYMVPRAFHMLGGDRWASREVDGLLSVYCYYVPFLAFNGISEAFVSSVASPSQLRRQAGWMGTFSVCFAAAAFLFLRVWGLGARGLVYANIVNMVVRTAWSFSFIKSYLYQHGSPLALSDVSLRPITYITGVMASTMLARQAYYGPGLHTILQDFTISVVYVLSILYLERKCVTKKYGQACQFLRGKFARLKVE